MEEYLETICDELRKLKRSIVRRERELGQWGLPSYYAKAIANELDDYIEWEAGLLDLLNTFCAAMLRTPLS